MMLRRIALCASLTRAVAVGPDSGALPAGLAPSLTVTPRRSARSVGGPRERRSARHGTPSRCRTQNASSRRSCGWRLPLLCAPRFASTAASTPRPPDPGGRRRRVAPRDHPARGPRPGIGAPRGRNLQQHRDAARPCKRPPGAHGRLRSGRYLGVPPRQRHHRRRGCAAVPVGRGAAGRARSAARPRRPTSGWPTHPMIEVGLLL